jgi:glycosyltransferase involved in cell wall biosynthesis
MRIGRLYMELHREMSSAGYRPDLVHLHNAAEAAVPACRMAEAWGVPLVVSENWTAYHAEHGRSFRPKEERAVKRALQAAAVHLPVSEHLGRAMARYAPDVRQVVIPNVVDAGFNPPSTPRSQEGPLRLLHVSSLIDDHKDITGMLHALSAAVERGADLTMDCWGGAGDGRAAVPRYKAMVDQLGLNGRVIFRGPAAPDQVVEAMQEADAFVLFSRYENLPCVLLEAWVTGLPTLATDVGGVGEHLGRHEVLGTLIQSGDREGLTQAIVAAAKAKASGQRSDHEAIQGYASARFTPEAVGGAIEAVYRSLV